MRWAIKSTPRPQNRVRERLVDQALLEERVARLPRGEAYVLEVVHRKRLLHGDYLSDGGGSAVPP
ncbi:hypothetical protein ABZV34_34775 [Streptomyces sp. NPDC005195]|uniref:hypothetical protein n=1 Tax=Streptomyces sp. NPDC005195 TaxID=3154561 RepID=UPI0033B50C30